jgi:hypothetical protein
MSLCLLSRRVQESASSNFRPCFRLSKLMIALLFDSVLLQSTCSTSQPRQQKSVLGQLPQPLCPKAEQSLSHAVVSGHGLNDPFTTGQERQRPRHLSEALKTHHLPSAGSPDHSFHSTNSFSDDRLCLVCSTHSSASCPVCDQDFCGNHLYECLDCNNSYCGRCLDDHRADGHWTDSDTALELNHGREKFVSSNFHIEKDGLGSAPDRMQCDQPACQLHASFVSAPARYRLSSGLSRYGTLTLFILLFARVWRAVRSCLSSSAASALVKLLWQSGLPEVSL